MYQPDRTSPPELSLFHRDEVSAQGIVGPIAIVVGYGRPAAVHVARYQRLIEHLLAHNSGEVAILTLIAPDSTPHAGARQGLIRVFQSLPDRFYAGFVVTSGGFGPAAQRAIITAVLTATKRGKRMKIMKSLTEGVDWVFAKTHPGGTLGDRAALRRLAEHFHSDETRRFESMLRSRAG